MISAKENQQIKSPFDEFSKISNIFGLNKVWRLSFLYT